MPLHNTLGLSYIILSSLALPVLGSIMCLVSILNKYHHSSLSRGNRTERHVLNCNPFTHHSLLLYYIQSPNILAAVEQLGLYEELLAISKPMRGGRAILTDKLKTIANITPIDNDM